MPAPGAADGDAAGNAPRRIPMPTFRISLALLFLSSTGLAFSACGTEGQPTGSTGTSSSASSSGAGGAAKCDRIPLTGHSFPSCDHCVQQNCCPELLACADASPFCPWACAAWNPSNPGCEPFHDLVVALRDCAATKCTCACTDTDGPCYGGVACSGDISQCDGGADGDAGTGTGDGEADGSSESG